MPIKLNGTTIFDESNTSHYSFPNYSAGTAYTTGTTITVPSNGWFVFVQDTGNYSVAEISIWGPNDTVMSNDTRLAHFYYRNHNDSNTAMIPVPKDYKVLFTTSYGYELTFYPCFTS